MLACRAPPCHRDAFKSVRRAHDGSPSASCASFKSQSTCIYAPPFFPCPLLRRQRKCPRMSSKPHSFTTLVSGTRTMLPSRRSQPHSSIFEFCINPCQESWARQEAAGMYNSAQYAEIKDKVECMNGTAIAGQDVFRCQNVSPCTIHHEFQSLMNRYRLTCFTSCRTPSSAALAVSDLLHGVRVHRSSC